MGLKSLAESRQRIVLWRRAVHLFHEYKSTGFLGPFKKAGYDEYKVEPTFLDGDGAPGEPDIVATSDTSWMCLEITSWDGSKKDKLESYGKLEPAYLGGYGLRKHQCYPNVLSARFDSNDDGPHCQLLLNDILGAKDCDYISDPLLRDAIKQSIGMDLKRIPQTKFTIVPECTKQEIRKGIVDQVMQLFEPGSQGFTAVEMTENALDSLNDKIGPKKKATLVSHIKEQMDILTKGELKDYMTMADDGKFKQRDDFQDHHATREKIGMILRKWAGLSSPKDTKLTDFP